MKKTIGIIGGMGPAATCDLYEKIIKYTDANTDQDHRHVIIDSNSNIGDRTKYIISTLKQNVDKSCLSKLAEAILDSYENVENFDASPLDEILKSAKMLSDDGADVIVMPCNTSHYFYDDIKNVLGDKFLGITDACLSSIKVSNFKKVAILATDGTICGGVYDKVFRNANVEYIYPTVQQQSLVMKIIYGYVKAGLISELNEIKTEVQDMLNDFQTQGADCVLLACTELPIAFDILDIDTNLQFIDTNLELAKAAISME